MPGDTSPPVHGAGWRSAMSRRMRESDARRQHLENHLRRIGARLVPGGYAREGTGELLAEFLKTVLGAIIGLWIIASVIAYFFGAKPVYTLATLGLFYSLQAAYYKYRLALDPGYTIPKCKCAGRRNDNTKAVLLSKESAMLKVPNAVVGAFVFVALALLVYTGRERGALLLAGVAVLASVYLGWVMVVKIANLCNTCMNIAAVNVLILWQLVR